MLEDTRNLIGDLLSGKIKDQRLALLAEEVTAAEKKLSSAVSKIATLEAENTELRTQINQLQYTVNNFSPPARRRGKWEKAP